MPNVRPTKKILIVEDEKPAAKAFGLKLGRAGFESEVAFDGVDALAILAKKNFDLILLDLVMPRMDGFEFLAELKNRNIKTPVIVTSSLSQEEDAKRAKDLGAIDYFVKSDTPIADIVEHVKKVLN
ncbi:MAG: response regulator [Candidatus Liptonbacteria bacterium]|nr:response regulator [Candidatus Liptonbacteria bacterium]